MAAEDEGRVDQEGGPETVEVRETGRVPVDPAVPVHLALTGDVELRFDAGEWSAFLAGVDDAVFDSADTERATVRGIGFREVAGGASVTARLKNVGRVVLALRHVSWRVAIRVGRGR
ncbi:hypothetical protein [Actinoalloteichus caeruleus]|uniref:hypothetical protein n=1 Tax=Actinoalloteichus cyanogriseus TaxID=2893586 RepID=UPI0012DD98A2|nr:hypothetical protein [Actinoalloteichus caeruleus]